MLPDAQWENGFQYLSFNLTFHTVNVSYAFRDIFKTIVEAKAIY